VKERGAHRRDMPYAIRPHTTLPGTLGGSQLRQRWAQATLGNIAIPAHLQEPQKRALPGLFFISSRRDKRKGISTGSLLADRRGPSLTDVSRAKNADSVQTTLLFDWGIGPLVCGRRCPWNSCQPLWPGTTTCIGSGVRPVRIEGKKWVSRGRSAWPEDEERCCRAGVGRG
jgi:hypothetical protein